MSYNELLNQMEVLGLYQSKNLVQNILNDSELDNEKFIDYLNKLFESEIKFRTERAKTVNIKTANFPAVKRLEDFDFNFQPTLNKNKIMDLKTLRFIDNRENIIFQGYSGTGKTHLAIAIGVEAASKRISTYYINCHQLILNLKKAQAENKLEQKLKFYTKYKLLLIDEVGFLPIDKDGAYLFFQLISRRYENKSTIITTNIQFSQWGELFSDSVLASAILDRLLHHSHIIRIEGESYRLKDKL